MAFIRWTLENGALIDSFSAFLTVKGAEANPALVVDVDSGNVLYQEWRPRRGSRPR